jgi:hypothetical protein
MINLTIILSNSHDLIILTIFIENINVVFLTLVPIHNYLTSWKFC